DRGAPRPRAADAGGLPRRGRGGPGRARPVPGTGDRHLRRGPAARGAGLGGGIRSRGRSRPGGPGGASGRVPRLGAGPVPRLRRAARSRRPRSCHNDAVRLLLPGHRPDPTGGIMTDRTTEVLDTFAAHLRALELPLPVDGAEQARAETGAALSQLDDHVIPRLESLDAPLLVVIGGSTGAGKSTLVNALVGHPVSRSGAIRPTTRRPVLLHHPAEEPWFAGTRILPGLARVHAGRGRDPEAPGAGDTTGDVDPATSLALHGEERIPQGLALLDAPDIDSVAAGNRELARQLLRAADLWLFVTTANRYADAVPWEVLRTAAERDVTVDVVMNRIPPLEGVAEELAEDLRGMLARQGIE